MDDLLAALTAQHAELGNLVDGCTDLDRSRYRQQPVQPSVDPRTPTRRVGGSASYVLVTCALCPRLSSVWRVRAEETMLPLRS